MSAQPVAQAGRSGAAAGKAAWLANCLCLAASPCFAVMALVSTIAGDADPICATSRAAFHLGGMGAMYWMMCAFHLPAWLSKFRQRQQPPATAVARIAAEVGAGDTAAWPQRPGRG